MTGNLSKREQETIKDNLRAFEHNFGEVRIENYCKGEGYYVYYPADSEEGNYIQYCYNIGYLDGWLYGVVQGCVRGEFKPYRTGGIKE